LRPVQVTSSSPVSPQPVGAGVVLAAPLVVAGTEDPVAGALVVDSGAVVVEGAAEDVLTSEDVVGRDVVPVPVAGVVVVGAGARVVAGGGAVVTTAVPVPVV